MDFFILFKIKLVDVCFDCVNVFLIFFFWVGVIKLKIVGVIEFFCYREI